MRTRSRPTRQRRSPAVPRSEDTDPRRRSHRTWIPGVRVAYVGGGSEAVNAMAHYWQARGATFIHCAAGGRGATIDLGRNLECADVVFHAPEEVSPELRRELVSFCERAEKPLIALDQTSLSDLEAALGSWCALG